MGALRAARLAGRMTVGLNFSEHSFRSFSDDHNDDERRRWVAETIKQLVYAAPNSYLVLLSNDMRSWPNFLPDSAYARFAAEILSAMGWQDRYLFVDENISYPNIIALLAAVHCCVAGRMHLAIAAFSRITPAVIMMSAGKGYSSLDKMQGAYRRFCPVGENLIVNDLTNLPRALGYAIRNRNKIRARIAWKQLFIFFESYWRLPSLGRELHNSRKIPN
jgi:polysaccharide pyruvyl transferase WcaK-like protein